MLILFSALIGLFIGSFIGVVVDRFGTNESAWIGRSVCEQCRVPLAAVDLIPVLSFVFLRGACRRCRVPISFRYPLIECATAILFALTAWHLTVPALIPIGFLPMHIGWFLLRDLVFVSILLILFLIDARHGVLPDVFTLPGIVFVFGMNLWLGIPWTTVCIGALAIGGFFAMQYFVSRGTWVGDGDIRLGALIGVMFGLTQGILALMIAYVIGALFAVVLLWKRRAGLKSTLAFGPFLAIAAWMMLICGAYLIRFLTFF